MTETFTIRPQVPTIFVAAFSDLKVKWIYFHHCVGMRVVLAGCRKVVKAKSDIEPVIEVPLEAMHALPDLVLF